MQLFHLNFSESMTKSKIHGPVLVNNLKFHNKIELFEYKCQKMLVLVVKHLILYIFLLYSKQHLFAGILQKSSVSQKYLTGQNYKLPYTKPAYMHTFVCSVQNEITMAVVY